MSFSLRAHYSDGKKTGPSVFAFFEDALDRMHLYFHVKGYEDPIFWSIELGDEVMYIPHWGCEVVMVSSRICERGTSCCVVKHKPASLLGDMSVEKRKEIHLLSLQAEEMYNGQFTEPTKDNKVLINYDLIQESIERRKQRHSTTKNTKLNADEEWRSNDYLRRARVSGESRVQITMTHPDICIVCLTHRENATPYCLYGIDHHEYIGPNKPVQPPKKRDINRCLKCDLHKRNPNYGISDCEHRH
jgi:hypothetical protein